jgi:predicted RNA polymerase sigma factor
VNDVELRELVPRALSVLVCRGADFATAEDAVQEALIRALSAWKNEVPADPTGWLITVAWRAFVDMTRSDAARRVRAPVPGVHLAGHRGDDVP